MLLYRDYQVHSNPPYTFERYQTDKTDNYLYLINNNIVCGIEYFFDNGSIWGAFFEDVNVDSADKRLYDDLKYFIDQEFYDANTISAIIIAGSYEGISSNIRIYKTTNNIIGYYSKTIGFRPECRNRRISNLNNLSEGTITSEEINYILEYLQNELKDNIIELALEDFSKFANRNNIENGLIEQQEDNDLLSPRELFNRPFEEVSKVFEKEKNAIFKLASQQCRAVSDDLTKKKERVLKPVDNINK